MPLAAGMGVRLGPLVFITALRHFLEKRLPEASKARDELLYDEVREFPRIRILKLH